MPGDPKSNDRRSAGHEVFSLDADGAAAAAPKPDANTVFSLDADAQSEPIVGQVFSLDADSEPVMGEIVELDSEPIMGEVVEPEAPIQPPPEVVPLPVPEPTAIPAFGTGSSAMMTALTDSKEHNAKAKRRRPVRPAVKITFVLPGEKSPFAK